MALGEKHLGACQRILTGSGTFKSWPATRERGNQVSLFRARRPVESNIPSSIVLHDATCLLHLVQEELQQALPYFGQGLSPRELGRRSTTLHHVEPTRAATDHTCRIRNLSLPFSPGVIGNVARRDAVGGPGPVQRRCLSPCT